jgi:hypothetical protein
MLPLAVRPSIFMWLWVDRLRATITSVAIAPLNFAFHCFSLELIILRTMYLED